MTSRLRIAASLAAVILMPPSANATTREVKYHQLKEFKVGRLVFTNVDVSLVAVKQELDPSGAEEVPILQFSSGHVTVKNLSGDADVLSGDIGDGTVADPAAFVRGTFHWRDARIDSAELAELKLRLKHVSVLTPLTGSKLTIPLSTVVFIKNDGQLSNDRSQLDLTVPTSQLKQAKVDWKGLAVQADLASTQAAEFIVGSPSSPEVRIANARYNSVPIEAQIDKPVIGILPDVKIISGTAHIDGLAVEFHDFKPILTAEHLSVDNPDLFVVSEDLPVVGSERVLATKLRIAGELNGDRIGTTENKTEVDSYIDTGDPDKIIEVLNLTGRLSPEVLLPTNNSSATFIRSTAAVKFLRGLADSPKQNKVTHLTVSGQNRIIDFVNSDVFDIGAHVAEKFVKDPNANPARVMCSIAIDLAAGKVAGSIVTSLIDLTYQSRGKLMITTWLTLGSEISPRFGVTGAHYVARVTNFLTETRTGKIVSKVAGEVVSPGDFVCDMLIGDRRPPDSLVTTLYRPQIMQSISNPPADWSDTAIRYSTLLDGVARIQLTPAEISVYNKVQADVTARSAFVTQVVQNREALDRHEEAARDQADKERSQRSAGVYEQIQKDREENREKAVVPLQQGAEEAQKIAQRQRAREAEEKQQQQQQQQQLQQTPYPNAQPGMGTSTGVGTTNANPPGSRNQKGCQQTGDNSAQCQTTTTPPKDR